MWDQFGQTLNPSTAAGYGARSSAHRKRYCPLAFGILFGGMVFALSLAVGPGSKKMVSRSLERESGRAAPSDTEELFRHL